MEDDRIKPGSSRGLWRYLYPVFLCAACLPQTLTAATLNQNGNCTVTDKNYPSNQTDCQDSNKHGGNRDTIIVDEGEVINVVAFDSNETVIAIEGGHHRDTIINHGEVYLQVTNAGEILSAWHNGNHNYAYYFQAGHKKTDHHQHTIKKSDYWLFNLDNVSLDAIGIAGGYGNDIIENYGLLDVSVITTLTDEAGSAETYSIGITGDKGNDQLVNEGQLNVTSDAVVTVDDVTFSLLDSGDAQRQAMAIAKGITGDKGKDEITNNGQLTVTANATVDTSDFNVALIGGPVDVDASSEAWAGAIGLDGGEGHDHISNQGTMTVTAKALADSDNVSIDLIDIAGGESVRAPLSANAMAIGIVGGEGNDHIYNSGSLNVTADAKADALDVQITGLSLSAGGANTSSEAIAIGIHGGNGQDDIYNDGNITVKAIANTNTDNFNVTVFDLSFIPPLFGFDNEQVATTATSDAVGIIAGDGNDKVTNTGSLIVQSDATVDIDGLVISLLGLDSEVNRTATATVTGITGDHGNDYIKNVGELSATSNARLELLNIGVDLLGGATNIDASNQASASAIGIDGGDGHDHIYNTGSTNVTANASINSVDVGISLLSALQGQDIRAPINVDANASGILGGDGHDYIENTGSLNVTADARADALDMDFSAIDISSGGMSTASESSAIGIDGGKGKSEIHNDGTITVNSKATTDTESFAFTLVDLSIVSDIVDLIFDTPVDASTTAKADGTGIKTGYDHDLISNHGSLSVTVDAITNTFEMSMSADGVSNFTELSDFPDFFLEEPMVDASTKAETSVIGITSGHGHDDIYNVGSLFAKATADVTANSVGVDLPLPDLLPQILPNIDTTEVATESKSSAMGITTGEGHDTVLNDGSVWSEAIANANSLSVNATLDVPIIPDIIDYNIPYSIEANLVDVGAKSEATAVGIETGKGHDYIYSIGDVTSKATTSSIATNIAATVAYSDDKVSFGGSLANASTEGKASAFGITSGSGDDMLHTAGTTLADAFVDTNSIGVTVDLSAQKDTIVGIGASVTKANSEAETSSVGIDLGEGNDDAHNEGSVTAKAHNNVDAVAVDVAVTIPAGDEFGIIGEGNWVETDTTAISFADGMLGGDGRDHIFNSGTVTADAYSDPDSIGVTANASGTKKGASIGIALTQAKSEGIATSNGIRGGKDKDKLVNTGTVDVDAKTDVDAVSVAASLTLTDKGVALTGTAADGSTNATSTASGMSGDEAEDVVRNEGTVDVLADADAESYSVSVAASGASKGVALGLALSRATSEADAESQGISGGSHNDELYSSGLVKSHAKANVIAGTISVAGGGAGKGLTVEGAAADGSTTGNATATGITGDQGEDHIVNEDMVDVLADVDATSVTVGVTANGTGTGATIGIALGRATSKGEADSHGIRGGSDSDYIANSGTVKSHALTTVIAGSGALAAGGAGKGLTVEGAGVDAATNATSTAEGITGDEGYVHIFNEGNVDVLADADATSISAAVSANGTGTGVTFGLGLARATSEADAVSTGLAGGFYGDDIYSFGLVKSHATSLVIAGSGALAAGGSGKGLTIEGAGADGSTKGTSTAVGINGKEGNDHIVNEGSVDVLADTDATSISVSATANGTGTGAAIGVAVARARSDGEADSIGINGGAGSDDIYSSGLVKSHAKSLVIAGSGGLSVGGTGTGVTAQLAGADAATKATSTAKGINGGEGYDHIYSEDVVDVLADADATSISVSVSGNFTGTGVSFGLGLARATSEADANSLGIGGGAYHDEIFSTALVKSHAKTNVIAGSGALTGGGTGTGLSVQGAGADAGTIASSIASGITGDGGSDHIYSEGMVDVLADAKATSIAVSATANGAGTGVALGIGLARANSEAESIAAGISGGAKNDEIASWEKVKSHAKTQVIAGSATIAGGGAGTGLNIQGAAADGLSKGSSTATGITGDVGDDILQSEGELDVYSEANTTSVSVSVSANGTGTGVSAGVALARAASEGEANSIGISGGGDNDHISNTQLLTAHAKSDVDAVSVSAAMGGTGTGVAIQGAAADAATVSDANATGISGDSGIDDIYNEGTLDVMADADATSVSVGLSVSGTGAGVGLGISVARAGTEATSNATGISLGAADEVIEEDEEPHHNKKHKDDKSHEYVKAGQKDGHGSDEHQDDKSCNKGNKHHDDKSCNKDDDHDGTEYVENHGKITARSYADADSVSVSAQLGISGAGLQAGGALVDASTKATATAQGIEGSQHKDIIINHDSIEATTDADATTTSVGVSLNADLKGATLSVAVTDATAIATAHSTGLAGLTGDDEISNQGSVTARAKSETDAISVSVPLGFSFVPLSVGIADNTATADSDASGIDGGTGHDYLESTGSILADAESDAFGISVSVAPIGMSLASANITADSTAVGMAGASGDDVIHQTETAALTAKSRAEATGTVVSVTLVGVAGADDEPFGVFVDEAGTNAVTQSTGISGGEGYDYIENLGSISTEAKSSATGTSVGVSLVGAAFADASTTATSHAVGIASGTNKDKVINKGAITTYAESIGEGTSVAAGLVGYFDGDANTTVDATTAGIELGAGDDAVINKGNINITAKSDASLTAGAGSLAGVSSAQSNISSNVIARGIVGGEGHDLIVNKASVTVGPATEADPWMSRLTSTNFSLNLAGVTNAESSLYSNTQSTGLDGEAGSDRIHNAGDLNITATSYSSSTGTSIGIFGTSEGGGTSGAITAAAGIAGGDGHDEIENKALIDINSNSYARISGTSFTFGGTGEAGGGMTASTYSVGISGGNDMDMLFNEGVIDVDAISALSSEGGSITPFGTSGSDFTTGAQTTATGIDGGAGEGVIDNLGFIDVNARSTVSQSGSSFTFGGTSEAGGTLAATTKATGIKGGNSHDEIWNEATILTTANSTLTSTGGSVTPFGTSDTDPTSGAVTTAMGIDSGHGENFITNHSLIDVNAGSSVSISGSTFTFGGTGAASGKLTATTNAWGIISGNSEDSIWTEGTIDVDVSASLSSSNNADTAFGTADAGATSGADISAFGIESGAGSDHIHSLSLIDVNADASVTLNASSYSFGGTSGTGGTLTAQARAFGISGGADDDYIKSEETILVDVSTSLDTKGGSNTTFGSSGSGNEVGSNSYATGIDGGSGHDHINNKGMINIFSSADVNSNNSSYVFGGYSETDSVVTAFTSAIGIAAGTGDDHVLNKGEIIVDTSSTDTNDGSSYAEFGSAGTAGTVTARSLSKGIDADTGSDVIINKGKIDVKGLARSSSSHNSDTGFLFGDGDARARATTSVTAHGIDAGTGDNYVRNEHEIEVEIYSFAGANAKSDGADIFDGDAFSRADSNSSGVAIGILAGNGDDTLINNGSITTTTSRIFTFPIFGDVELYSGTSSHADADGDGIDGDGTVRSYATTNLLSVGVDAGDGDNAINNTGTISVNAKAIATATYKVDSDAGGSTSIRRTASVTANAFGIRTGAGRDHVINEGDINVRTIASSNTSINHITATATGIATGAGDDVIENRGTITASITRNGVTSAGTMIDTGSGNDIVSLLALSKNNGDIKLGSDNDTLNVFGSSSHTGKILGGSGNDTLVFIGEGNFSTAVTDFQHTIKQGDGTYTLNQLAPMEKISIEQGVLEIDGDYEFAAGSTYMPSVSNGDGQGKLVINGAVNFSAASINVMKGRGHHRDGEKQTVLYASEGILNSMSFDNIKLPEKTPLLQFNHEITADEVQVSTSVASFKTVASTNNQRIIAHYLDGLLPNAEGNISETLGEIQAMKAGGHGSAFSSVNPESYVNTQQALESSVKNYTSTLLQRTRGLRNIKQYDAFVQPGFFSSEQGDLLVKNQPADSLSEVLNLSTRARRPYGAWVKSYWQDGQLDQTAANTGFDFDSNGYALGYDKWLDRKRVIGMSLGINQTNITADNNRTRSDIDSQLFSLYTGYVTDEVFIDGAISYGYNTYNTQRDVTIGTTNNTVVSEHNGDVYGASVVGGLFFLVNTWDLETYAGLQYLQQDEEGFQESGAGGVSLSVVPRKSDLLSSEVGLRFGKQFKKRNSSMFTEFGIAWIHEYTDDNSVEASFVDSPNSSFTVYSQDIDNDGALINLGLSYTNKKGLTGTAEYRTDIRDGYSDQTFFANIQYQFE